jgi:hypothetical protein
MNGPEIIAAAPLLTIRVLTQDRRENELLRAVYHGGLICNLYNSQVVGPAAGHGASCASASFASTHGSTQPQYASGPIARYYYKFSQYKTVKAFSLLIAT